jgi:hypothetical protein
MLEAMNEKKVSVERKHSYSQAFYDNGDTEPD